MNACLTAYVIPASDDRENTELHVLYAPTWRTSTRAASWNVGTHDTGSLAAVIEILVDERYPARCLRFMQVLVFVDPSGVHVSAASDEHEKRSSKGKRSEW